MPHLVHPILKMPHDAARRDQQCARVAAGARPWKMRGLKEAESSISALESSEERVIVRRKGHVSVSQIDPQLRSPRSSWNKYSGSLGGARGRHYVGGKLGFESQWRLLSLVQRAYSQHPRNFRTWENGPTPHIAPSFPRPRRRIYCHPGDNGSPFHEVSVA